MNIRVFDETRALCTSGGFRTNQACKDGISSVNELIWMLELGTKVSISFWQNFNALVDQKDSFINSKWKLSYDAKKEYDRTINVFNVKSVSITLPSKQTDSGQNVSNKCW